MLAFSEVTHSEIISGLPRDGKRLRLAEGIAIVGLLRSGIFVGHRCSSLRSTYCKLGNPYTIATGTPSFFAYHDCSRMAACWCGTAEFSWFNHRIEALLLLLFACCGTLVCIRNERFEPSISM
jgi:hypothetical protein